MPEDKWFRLINDEIADIPAGVQQLKSEYWKKSILFIILILAGSTAMGVARGSGQATLGCFVAVTGIVGIMALATMCHTQLCLYRALKEFRQMRTTTGEQDAAGDN